MVPIAHHQSHIVLNKGNGVSKGLQKTGNWQMKLPFQTQRVKVIVGFNKTIQGTSLTVQWLRLCASTAGGMGLEN